MPVLIIGDGGLLKVLKTLVPPRLCSVPAGDDVRAQTEFLTRNPVPPGKRGIILADAAANWLPVAKAGWTIYWCDASQIPVGARALPESYLTGSVADMVRLLWNLNVVDKRLVVDVMRGMLRDSAPLLMVTSNTGGVGKTVTSRRLAERAAQQRIPTLLIDGNMRQSSQRSFFDPSHEKTLRTVADWRPGMKPQAGTTHGKQLGVAYDITFAPPAGMTVTWKHYRQFIEQARKVWSFIVLDLDRISADDMRDDTTAAGAMLVPYLRAGDLALIIVKAGRQTQGDALNLLGAIPHEDLPRECIGIKDTVPEGLNDYQQLDYTRYGMFLGTEYQSAETGKRIARGEVNWADPKLDEVRERVLDWALPDHGFDPSKFSPRKKRKGLFG